MTNEELAAKGKKGDRKAIHILWERTERLIRLYMSRYLSLCKRCGMERDDLISSEYFALIHALERFNPHIDRSFNALLFRSVQFTALQTLGLRKSRGLLPEIPLSLDAPASASNSEGISLGESLACPNSSQMFEAIELDCKATFSLLKQTTTQPSRPTWIAARLNMGLNVESPPGDCAPRGM